MGQAFDRAKSIIEAMRAKVEQAKVIRESGPIPPSRNPAPDLAKAELPKVAPQAAPAPKVIPPSVIIPQRPPSPYGRATPLE